MKILNTGFVCAMLVTATVRADTLDYVVDQQHDQPVGNQFAHNIQAVGPLVQEFVPALQGLNVVEIWTEDFGTPKENGTGATLQLLIRANSTNGTIISASEPVRLPDGHSGMTRFEFADGVQLIPGDRYAMEVLALDGDMWGVRSYGENTNTYAAGRYFRGTKTTELDMVFRMGFKAPSLSLEARPSNRIRWKGNASLSYRVWSSVNLIEWRDRGLIASSDSEFVFEDAETDERQAFYKVSLP